MPASMAGMDCVVEIQAGQDGKDVGLQRRDQKLEGGEGDGGQKRQDGAEYADGAERPENRDEAGKDLQRDVAGEHVSEETDRQADRPRDEGEDLDHRDEG